jgi:hypothetical protein
MTSKKLLEDNLKKWKTNQSTKINLIGCDTIVNSPSLFSFSPGRKRDPEEHFSPNCEHFEQSPAYLDFNAGKLYFGSSSIVPS